MIYNVKDVAWTTLHTEESPLSKNLGNVIHGRKSRRDNDIRRWDK
jgi:hypothetical protein